MPRTVEVTAPSRLHFGLFSFGAGAGPRYGGVGAMIAQPVVRLRATMTDRFTATGRYAVRTSVFASKYADFWGLDAPPACRIKMLEAPDQHSGLGLGTQLGLSVAATLAAVEGRDVSNIAQLAASVGRGKRSAVGAHGFRHGGLIIDDGKAEDEPLGRLGQRIALPGAWRFVLLRPETPAGLAGADEVDAFDRLPPPSAETTSRLRRLAAEELAPAAKAADFGRFSTALHEFNVTAGECFAVAQGGPFANEQVARVVDQLRSQGCIGCGQSSWGPTVFGLVESEDAAKDWRQRLESDDLEVKIVAPSNSGAQVEVS